MYRTYVYTLQCRNVVPFEMHVCKVVYIVVVRMVRSATKLMPAIYKHLCTK